MDFFVGLIDGVAIGLLAMWLYILVQRIGEE